MNMLEIAKGENLSEKYERYSIEAVESFLVFMFDTNRKVVSSMIIIDQAMKKQEIEVEGRNILADSYVLFDSMFSSIVNSPFQKTFLFYSENLVEQFLELFCLLANIGYFDSQVVSHNLLKPGIIDSGRSKERKGVLSILSNIDCLCNDIYKTSSLK
eukprot:CAMPEP_0170537318 /NCGR_PEP_ID=MMETSP0209-20121228/102643_1 /TAXON_ID=665100 ORGANISM="Litonotus pictus, Strain P1" /NCGR_SAMPLE_ID=MMETSP0209 /ASSEMBLY_ACC=CAM_ASM_000301 /LENGTH=156 /DNA_ID=CAMNT_0010838793 /DNA_START=1982 /DNA_END=2449 /DNA_ORIENTATION=-